MTRDRRIICPVCGNLNELGVEECKTCSSALVGEEEIIVNALQQIPGVGKSRAKKIVKAVFNDIKELEVADSEILLSVDGIGKSTAEDILSRLERSKKEDGQLYLCGGCGSFVGTGFNACPDCAADKDFLVKKEEGLFICNNCGSFVSPEAEKCSHCGFSFDEEKDVSEDLGEVLDEETQNKRLSEEQKAEEEVLNALEREFGVSAKTLGALSLGDDAKLCDNCGGITKTKDEKCSICGYLFSEASVEKEEVLERSKPEAAACEVCGAFKTDGSEQCSICEGIASKPPEILFQEEKKRGELFICDACGSLVEKEQERCSLCGSKLEHARRSLEREDDFADLDILKKLPGEGGSLQKESNTCNNCGSFVSPEAEKCYRCTTAEYVGTIERRDANAVIEEINKSLLNLKSIDTDVIAKILHKVKGDMLVGKIESAYGLGLEAIKMCEDLELFLENSSKLEKELKLFKKNGWVYEPYMNKLNSARNLVESGRTKSGITLVEELLKKVEAKKKNRKELQHKINDAVSTLKPTLEAAKKLKIHMESERKLISNALRSSKKGDLQKALDRIVEVKRISIKKVEERIAEKIEKMQKNDMLTKAMNEGDYDKCASIIIQIKKREANSKNIDSFGGMIEAAKSIGVDCSDCEKYYRKALKDEDEENKFIYFNKAKSELVNHLPPKLQKAVKEGVVEMEKAREEGKKVSKSVMYLKQANTNLKDKRYLKALSYLRAFRQTTKQMS